MTFTARFRSACANCGRTIEPDSQADWEDGEVIHAACRGVDLVTPIRAICQDCFMEVSVAGTCGCDE